MIILIEPEKVCVKADATSQYNFLVYKVIKNKANRVVSQNGDGTNDTWIIKDIQNYPNSVVRVFNNNGSEVFYARNYQNDWNGHYKNWRPILPVGFYYYRIDFEGDDTIDEDGWLYITR